MYKIALLQAGNDALNVVKSVPLGLSYIKTYVEAHSEVEVDIRIYDDTDSITQFSPHLVGISSMTPFFNDAIRIGQKIRKITDATIVLGGYHITALPEEIKHDCFDIGVIGEGEKTFTELINALNANTPLKHVNGLVYKDNGIIRHTQKRELLKPIEIMMPISGRLPLEEQALNMMTSRGCLYNCKFCDSSKFYGSYSLRYLSPEAVVREIYYLHKTFNAKKIQIFDDIFIYPEDRLHAIVKLLEQEDLNNKIEFTGFVRSNLVNDSIFELLKRMNMNHISVGFESGSDRILKIYKPGVSVEDNQRCIDLAISHGIKVTPFIMVGMIGETEDDLLKTASFIKRNKQNFTSICQNIHFFIVLPGTEIWNSLDEEMRLSIINEQKWEHFKPNSKNSMYFNDAIIPHSRFVEIIETHFPAGTFCDSNQYQKKLIKLIEAHYDKNGVLLYGAGNMGENVINHLQQVGISVNGIIDSHYNSLPPLLNGKVSILSPEAAMCSITEKIFISSMTFHDEIVKQLLLMGIKEHRIISPFL